MSVGFFAAKPPGEGAAGRALWLRMLLVLASPRWMVLFFCVTAAGALAIAYQWVTASAMMTWPLGLFAANLVAAIAMRPALRRDAPLLVLHLALLILVILFGLARLTYLDSATTLGRGASFDGSLLRDERGPLHPDRLDTLRFANEGFVERIPEGGRFKATYNQVRVWDADGRSYQATIGDDQPLLAAGYRIYTSRLRGYSPVFHWRSASGEELGAVQLNDTRMGDAEQTNEWQIPGGPRVWAKIDFMSSQDLNPGEVRSNLAADQIPHVLVLRAGEDRYEMKPGGTITLGGGTLTYVRLNSWMGYRITYDPTRAWVLATALVVVASLLWFYWRRFRGRISWE